MQNSEDNQGRSTEQTNYSEAVAAGAFGIMLTVVVIIKAIQLF